MKVFFDGGARPLPHGMEIAVAAGGIAHVERGLGPGGSMEAEWLALIAAARYARNRDLADVVLLGDAAAVIAQAKGLVRMPAAHLDHRRTFDALYAPLVGARLRYVKRTQNLAGIALAAARW